MAARKQKVQLRNTGPIRAFDMDLGPGVWVLHGDNGVGKTHAISAVVKALGGEPEIPLTATDGSTRGQVIINDIPILAITKLNRQTGKADVSLLSSSPLATLIDPGIADPVRAEGARLKALLQLVDCPVTDETLSTLVGGDAEAVAYLEGMPPGDVVTTADSIRRNMHLAKRHHENLAVMAGAEATAAKFDAPETLTDMPIADAQKASDDSLMNLQRLTGEASQRLARERERAEIEATLGERPDATAATTAAQTLQERFKEASARSQDLFQQIALLNQKYDASCDEVQELSGRVDMAIDTADDVEGQAEAWDRRRAILDSEITGATEADVEAAQTAVLERRTALELARESEAYRRSLSTVAEAQKRQAAAQAKAEHFEGIALKVTSRLADVLASSGVDGLTVDEGALSVVHPDGTVESFSRLSLGEKTRVAADLVAKRSPEGTILPLSDRFWHALSDKNKAEVHQIFVERGITVITESADAGELRVEAFGK